MVSCVGVHAALQEAYDPKMTDSLWDDMVSVTVHRVWDPHSVQLQAPKSLVAWAWDAAGPVPQKQQTKPCSFHSNPFPSCPSSSLEQDRCSRDSLLSTLGLSLQSHHYFFLIVSSF